MGFEHTLIEEVVHAKDAAAKHRAALAVAKHVVERRNDRAAATPWYEEALRAHPQSIDAAAPLADIYLASENWAKAAAMLELVIDQLSQRRTAQPGSPVARELCEQLFRFGDVARRLEKKQKSLGAYDAALQINPAYLPALRRRAEMLLDLNRLDDAAETCQRILAKHRAELSASDKVDIHFQLAEIELMRRKPDGAWNHLEQALGINPDHVPSLRALIGIADRAGQFDSAAAHRQHLLELLQGNERFQVCVELGALAREKLSNARLAVQAYLKALEVQPDALAVLDALFATYRDCGQPQQAADLVDRMLQHPGLQPNRERRIQLLLALGDIAAHRLGDVDRGERALAAALELEPTSAEALRALEALLRGHKRWRQLDERYLQLATRLEAGEAPRALRGSIRRRLAELRLNQLQDRAAALPAYAAAADDLPKDLSLQEAFADLGIEAPGYEDRALSAYLRALPAIQDPGKVCSAAARLAMRRGQEDAAFLAARAQECFISRPGPMEQKLLERLAKPAGAKPQPQDTLSEQMWKKSLLHPAVRGPLGELMAVLVQAAGGKYAASLSDHQVSAKRHRIDLSGATQPALQQLRWVGRLLGIEGFELYSPYLAGREGRAGWRPMDLLQLGKGVDPAADRTLGLAACQTDPISLVAGGRFFDDPSPAELNMMIGSTLGLMRPELAMAQRVPMDRLAAIVQAAIGLSSGVVVLEVPEKEIRREQKILEKALDGDAPARLQRATAGYLEISQPGDLERFVEGVELTALRTAMLVVGDPEPIKRKLLAEIGPGPRMDAQIRELIAFAVSGDLAGLRAGLGIGLHSGAAAAEKELRSGPSSHSSARAH